MAVTVSNIIVGQATVSIGDAVGSVEDIGATQDGVELSWEPDMVDIEVDQFGDAAKVIQSMVKVMLKTTLAEATLRNLARAWGYDDTADGSDIKVAQDGADTNTFMFGIENVYPHERAIVTVGNAPGSGATATKTRTFTTKRAISYAASSHSMKRAEATVFPVEFRILPTAADLGYEYGKIIDSTA